MRRTHLSGENAREWRLLVASLARRSKETVLTYKFPLDIKDGDINFDRAMEAYRITASTRKGSLIALLCALHLSGFRLFSNTTQVETFRNASRYPDKKFSQTQDFYRKQT